MEQAITIRRNGGRFAATFKTSSDVICFTSSETAGGALVIFGVIPEAQRVVDALFTFARVDEITMRSNEGWRSELKYWRNGDIHAHVVEASTPILAIYEHILFLLKGE